MYKLGIARIAGTLAAARACSYALSFLRNLILARSLSKADFGLVALFSVTVSLLEVTGKFSFGQLIVQSANGNDRGFVATAQGVQLVVGVASMLTFVMISGPMAEMCGVPTAKWAFAALAVVPLGKALESLDSFRLQRSFEFGAAMRIELVPQVLVTILTFPVVYAMADYRAIVVLICLKALATVSASHVWRERAYQLGWNRSFAGEVLRFCWPMLLNGLVLFLCQQADQMLVGTLFSLELLATYAVCVSVVAVPWFVFAQVLTGVLLPLFARAKEGHGYLEGIYVRAMRITAPIAVIVALPLIILGQEVIVTVYGGKYSDVDGVLALLSAAASIRFLRAVCAVSAMAVGDTINQLVGNLWRATSLFFAFAFFSLSGEIESLGVAACAGECLALGFSLCRLRRRSGVCLQKSAAPVGLCCGFSALGVFWSQLDTTPLWDAGFLSISIGVVFAILFFEVERAKRSGARWSDPTVSQAAV